MGLLRALFLPGNFRFTLHAVELVLLGLLAADLAVRFLLRPRRLVHLANERNGKKRRRFRIGKSLVFGTKPGRGVRVDAQQVSRRHVELRRDPTGRITAHDLGSTNGTYYRSTDSAPALDLRDRPDGVELEPGGVLELGHSGPTLRTTTTEPTCLLPGATRLLAWLGLIWSGLHLGRLANLDNLPAEPLQIGRVVLDFTPFLAPGPMIAIGLLATATGLIYFLSRSTSDRARQRTPAGRPEAGAAILVLLVLGVVVLYPLLPRVALRYAEAAQRAYNTVTPDTWRELENWDHAGRNPDTNPAPALVRRYDQGRGALRWAANLSGRAGQPLVSVTYFRQAGLLFAAALIALALPRWCSGAGTWAHRFLDLLRRPLSERLVRAADHGSPLARWLRPIAYCDVAIGFLAAAVVAATLWSPLGTSLGRGKSLYLRLPGLTVQSVELVKALFVLFVTGYFARQGSLLARVARRRYYMPYVLAVLGTLALTGFQADMGALFMLGLFLGLVFVAATGHLRLVLAVPLLVLPGLALAALLGRFSVVSTRLGIWISPRTHPLGEQLVEARQLLLSSGWFGVPPHRQLAFRLPDVQGDMVLVALAERFGLLGLLALIGCWCVLVASLLRSARRSTSSVSILLSSVAALVLVQVLTQAGGIMGLLPLTGVPIPWLSHGLSASLIFTGLAALALAGLDGPAPTPPAAPVAADPRRYLDWTNLTSTALLAALAVLWMAVLPTDGRLGRRGEQYLWQGARQQAGVAPFHPNRFARRSLPRGAVTAADGTVLARNARSGGREYPGAEVFFHPVGYAGGLAFSRGVEGAVRSFLAGSSFDRAARLRAFKADVHHGPDVVLTLDAELQRAAWEKLDGRRGAAVVLDLADGSLLALVSSPSIDPNGVGLDAWRELEAADGAPLRPRATHSTDAYSPPGSAFKIVVAAAVLEQGAAAARRTTYCSGRDTRLDVSCAHGSVHGRVDLHRALVVSCNVYFARAVGRVGVEAVLDAAERFGFNSTFNLLTGVPGAELRPGLSTVGADNDVSERDLARIGYGQGPVSATPLQMARMGAVVATGGELLEPRLARSLALVHRTGGGPAVVWQHDVASADRRRGLSPEIARALQVPLTEVFERGTARSLDKLWFHPSLGWQLGRRPPEGAEWQRVGMAGKTGSAWKTRRDRTDDAWMVAWAPSEAPRVAVSVLVEDAGEGGRVAGPIAVELIRRALESLGHRP